jgi:hypothetical protein
VLHALRSLYNRLPYHCLSPVYFTQDSTGLFGFLLHPFFFDYICTKINKLFEAAQSAADGQLGLYEINKGSLIAVLTYTLLAIQSHKTIVKALWPHKPQTFLQQ